MMVLWHNKCQLTRHTCTLGHIQLFMLMAMREGAHKRNWSQKEIFNDLRSVTEARLAEEDGWFLRWTWLERLRPRAAIPGLRGSFNCTLGTASIERRDLLLASKPSALCHTHDTHDSAAVKSAFLAEPRVTSLWLAPQLSLGGPSRVQRMSALPCLLEPLSPTHAPSLRFQQRHVLKSIHLQTKTRLKSATNITTQEALPKFWTAVTRWSPMVRWQTGKWFGFGGQIVPRPVWPLPFLGRLKEFTITNYQKARQSNQIICRWNHPSSDLCSSGIIPWAAVNEICWDENLIDSRKQSSRNLKSIGIGINEKMPKRGIGPKRLWHSPIENQTV